MNSAISDRPHTSKRVGVIQSNYIPWKGYFDFIAEVDEFVIFDDVQFTRRDWRNRNLIKTASGLKWLTIPVEVKGKYFQRVDETRIAGEMWFREHLSTLRHAYGRAGHFREEWAWIEPLYESCAGVSRLTEINVRLIRAICARLEITTTIRLSSEFPRAQGKNERLIEICKGAGATEYLSGPAARDYIDEELWRTEGIAVSYKSYSGYPQYPQMHEPFEHGVTVLDLLFNTGPQARRFITRLGHD